MYGKNSIRTVRPNHADDARTVRIGLLPHVQERMQKLYGAPGSARMPDNPDMSGEGCLRTLAGWFSRQIGR